MVAVSELEFQEKKSRLRRYYPLKAFNTCNTLTVIKTERNYCQVFKVKIILQYEGVVCEQKLLYAN